MDFAELLNIAQTGGHAVVASALVPHEPPLRGKALALQADWVDVRFAPEVKLAIGERVRLELAVEGAPRAVVVRAVVAGRNVGERTFQFRLLSRPSADSEPNLDTLLNRRRAERFRLAVPLRIGLCDADGANPARAFAMLDGASQGGCSLVVDLPTERAFVATERVLLEVRRALSPDESGTTRVWRIAATIAYRRLRDEEVCYGCRLEPAAGRERDAQELVDYLLERDLDDRMADLG